jgi:serine/threonine protein kinase
MAYLHNKMIVFRDLKPANTGFDSRGVLKLFDFGFALCTAAPTVKLDDGKEPHLLYDKCGTPRYMAPEVGLEMGYCFTADVHSFGILLWRICALKKPLKINQQINFTRLSL